ncbi:TonB-dependent receptor [Burkholderiaceae bacterium DAT-1]|nr:TonB-dependent receptor [Burkholderiaceae bacterium DAT-1]
MKIKYLALAISAIGLSQAAFAEDADAPKKVEKITVTGSNIKRINVETATPVEVLSKADIAKSGAGSVAELMSQLPSVSADFGTSSNSFSQGAASVSLRGMGEKNVLVLLNGRRIANYAYANYDHSFVDLNSLPLSAIERVEVLKDGASALYGSDAVAGVVNFITKTNYTGTEIQARYGQNTAGDGRENSASIAAGFGDISSEKQNLLVSFNAYYRDPTLDSMHELTKSSDLRKYGGQDGRSTSAFTGSWAQQSDYWFSPIPGCPTDRQAVSDRKTDGVYCRYETRGTTVSVPRAERAGGSAFYTRELNANHTFFAEVGLNRNVTHFDTGYASLGFTDSGNSGKQSRIIDSDMAAYPTYGSGGPLVVARDVYEAGRGSSDLNSNLTRGVAGLKGQLGSWDYETSLAWSQVFNTTVDTKKLLSNAVTDAYVNGGYNPFVAWNERSDVNKLLYTSYRTGKTKLGTFEFKMSNSDLFTLGANPVGFAWGAQMMRDRLEETFDAQALAGNIENMGGNSADGSRTIRSLYGEFSLSPIKQIEAQLALRYDSYSDAGNSTNPKLAVAFRPNDTLLLRGSVTTAFKAPSLSQLNMSPVTSYTQVADWVRCDPLGYVGSDCRYDNKQLTLANKALKPETSTNYSLGAVFQPINALMASIDFFKIKQKDTIETLDAQYVLAHEYLADKKTKDPVYSEMIDRQPRNPGLEAKYPGLHDGRLIGMHLPFMNIGRTETSGYELGLRYTLNAGELGRFTVNEQLSRMLVLKKSYVPELDPTNRLGDLYNPAWRNAARLSWVRGSWSADLVTRTTAGTYDLTDLQNMQEDSKKLSTYSSSDLNVAYTGFRNLVLNAGVQNLTDKQPRFAKAAGAFWDNTSGRYVYVSGTYRLK